MMDNPYESPKAPPDNGLGMALLRLRLEIILVALVVCAIVGGLALLLS
jgi:hypothetical protein